MKRVKSPAPKANPPASIEEILAFGWFISKIHQEEWQREIQSAAPDWTLALSLHLRLVELEHMQSAVAELLV